MRNVMWLLFTDEIIYKGGVRHLVEYRLHYVERKNRRRRSCYMNPVTSVIKYVVIGEKGILLPEFEETSGFG